MTVGEYIQKRRESLQLKRSELAKKTGISNTEVNRIETGVRRNPSVKNLCALAEALNTAQDELMKLAGYSPEDDTTSIERTFPGLKTEKQQQTLEKIADTLVIHPNLNDDDLDGLIRQMDMCICYIKRKKDRFAEPQA